MTDRTDAPTSPALDPVFVNARREAIIILSAWVVCLLWTVPACVILGYDKPVEDVTFILGIPNWVFIGIVVPWAVTALFSIVFVLFIMKNDDLGEDMMAADASASEAAANVKPQAGHDSE